MADGSFAEIASYEERSRKMAKGGAAVIGYTAVGDYLMPNIAYGKETLHLGRYSRLRQKFLKENHGGVYSEMQLSGSLWEHLAEIESACQARLERIISALAKSEGVTESLSSLKRHIHSGRLAAHRHSKRYHRTVVFNIPDEFNAVIYNRFILPDIFYDSLSNPEYNPSKLRNNLRG